MNLLGIVLGIVAIAMLASQCEAFKPEQPPPEERGETGTIPDEPAVLASECPDWITAEGVTCIDYCQLPAQEQATLQQMGADIDCEKRK